ncbi:MAG: hypothetical protein AB7F35_24145 [Acetobacteraceae bacterium]
MFQLRPIGHRLSWLAIAVAGVVLTSCGEQARPVSGPRVFAADVSGGARKCETSKPDVEAGKTVPATMTVGNDGGWCGVVVTQANGRPFDTGLLTVRPDHGKVLVHRVGDVTRLTYTPTRGYVGQDAFSVKLIPGDATVRVAVTITAP